MHTEEPRDLQGVELGYDPRDIDAKGIYRVVAYFFLFALFFFGVGALYYIYIGKIETSQRFDPRKPAIVGPKLQGNVAAKIDIMQMRQTERAQMESFGTNKELAPDGSTVERQRIPVEAEMRLLAGRGLPDITSDKTATSPGNTIPQKRGRPRRPLDQHQPERGRTGSDPAHGIIGQRRTVGTDDGPFCATVRDSGRGYPSRRPAAVASAQSGQSDFTKSMGIDQRLGDKVPLDVAFRDETGATRTFGSLLKGRPLLVLPFP